MSSGWVLPPSSLDFGVCALYLVLIDLVSIEGQTRLDRQYCFQVVSHDTRWNLDVNKS